MSSSRSSGKSTGYLNSGRHVDPFCTTNHVGSETKGYDTTGNGGEGQGKITPRLPHLRGSEDGR